MDHRLKETSETNRKWFFEYKEHLSEIGIKKGTATQYLNKLLLFYSEIKEKNIESITLTEVENFIYSSDNPSTANLAIYALKRFFSFVKERKPISLNVDELSKLTYKTRDSDKQNPPRALTIEDIVQLRASLEKNQDYVRWFSFEMTYQHGFSLEELSKCTIKTWDTKNECFTIKKDVPITGHALRMIRSHGVLNKTKVSTSTHQQRISKLSKYINRDIKYSDLTKTRERTFFSCPRCEGIYESSPENWTIFEYSIDHSKWMVCKKCAGEYHE